MIFLRLFLKHEATYTNTTHIHHDRRQAEEARDDGRAGQVGWSLPAPPLPAQAVLPATRPCPPVSWPRSLTFHGVDYVNYSRLSLSCVQNYKSGSETAEYAKVIADLVLFHYDRLVRRYEILRITL